LQDTLSALRFQGRRDNFYALLESAKVPVLVEFGATWCAPCKALQPLLDNALSVYPERVMLITVDAGAEPELAQEQGVSTLPTVLLFRGGKVVDRIHGVLSQQRLGDFLRRHSTDHESPLLVKASDALQSGQSALALELCRQAYQTSPGRVEALLLLIRVLAERAKETRDGAYISEAEDVLSSSPATLQRHPKVAQWRSRFWFLRECAEEEYLPYLELITQGSSPYLPNRLLHEFMAATGEQRQAARTRLVQLLDTMEDRQLASRYRRALFSN
tara:strand:- start:893 stop:1711 length:819 start_codon:yes stop_codon:yes gene_type:complete